VKREMVNVESKAYMECLHGLQNCPGNEQLVCWATARLNDTKDDKVNKLNGLQIGWRVKGEEKGFRINK